MTRPTVCLLLVLLSLALSSCGTLGTRRAKVTPQRPKISNNTKTTAFGTWELEAGALVDPGDAFALDTRLKVGVSPTAELFASFPPYIYQDVTGDDVNGIGDLTIGFRQRLMNESKAYPATAFELQGTLPVGDDDLAQASGGNLVSGVAGGGDFIDFAGAFILDRTFEQVYVTLYYKLGFSNESVSGSGVAGDLNVQHTAAIAGTMPIHERWSGLAELAGSYIPEESFGPLVANLAALYDLGDTAVLDAGVLLGLNDDAEDFAIRAGITTNLGIFF